MLKFLNIDHTPWPYAACTAAAAGLIDLLQQYAQGLFGVSIAVPLFAFAGTLYGMSYRAPLAPVAFWSNLIVGTFVATGTAPLVQNLIGQPTAVAAGIATVMGFALQYLQPWLLSRRDPLLDKAAGKVLGQQIELAPSPNEEKPP